jgi:hypothetical protein
MVSERRTMMTGEEQTLTYRSANAARIRLGALAFALTGVVLVLYPVIRPFSDEVSLQAARVCAVHSTVCGTSANPRRSRIADRRWVPVDSRWHVAENSRGHSKKDRRRQ